MTFEWLSQRIEKDPVDLSVNARGSSPFAIMPPESEISPVPLPLS